MTIIRRTILAGLFLGLSACSEDPNPAFIPAASPYFGLSDQMVELNSSQIRYRSTGPDTAPTIILLHGFTDSLHTWDALADDLDDEFRVLRPDLPGHGLSGGNAENDYSNAALVTFVGDFIEAVDADAPILVGNSLGGLAAWRFAAAEPNTVGGLVLLAPGGVPHNGVGDEPLPVPAMMKAYLNHAPEAGVKMALSAMHANPARVTDESAAQFRDLMRIPGNADAFVARAAQFTLPEPADDMAKIAVPTTILWGVQDVVLPIAQADVFAANIAHAAIIRLDDVGHMPQSEAPDQVAAAIRAIAAQIQNPSEATP